MLFSIASIFSYTFSTAYSIIAKYGYEALFALLVLEAASLPIPSEVILPVTGYLILQGLLNPFIAFAAIILGGLVGMAIDYYIAYLVGKDIVYRHLSLFHIKRERLEAFDKWFARNGPFTVFVARLMPVVRGLVNFPAGFAMMDQKKFYAYSLIGTVLWDILLMSFGYYFSKYLLSSKNLATFLAGLGLGLGLFALALFAIFKYGMKRIAHDSEGPSV